MTVDRLDPNTYRVTSNGRLAGYIEWWPRRGMYIIHNPKISSEGNGCMFRTREGALKFIEGGGLAPRP